MPRLKKLIHRYSNEYGTHQNLETYIWLQERYLRRLCSASTLKKRGERVMYCRNRRCCCRCAAAQNVQQASTQHIGFCEYTAELRLAQVARYAGPFCVKDARTITVFITNTGTVPVTAYLEISPDGAGYLEDPQRLVLQAGALGALTPYLFSKYLRVAAVGASQGSILVNIQMQNG